ncbi:MAG: hypothetical protein U9R79_02760, partial [Armatimonadota bacterium]|nr:hypothetical protein [Armatimonadota bacterium]
TKNGRDGTCRLRNTTAQAAPWSSDSELLREAYWLLHRYARAAPPHTTHHTGERLLESIAGLPQDAGNAAEPYIWATAAALLI